MEWFLYSSNSVAEKIKNFAKQKGISVRKMLSEIGLSPTVVVNMKTSMPKADNLAKIADYLDCSVDYLLGRVDDPAEYKNIERGETPQAKSPEPVQISDNQTLHTIQLLVLKMDAPDQDYMLQKAIELLNASKYKKGGGLSTAQKM